MPFHRDRDSALFRRQFRLQAANKPATSWPRRWLHPGLTVDYTIEFARVLRGSSPGAAFSFLSGAGQTRPDEVGCPLLATRERPRMRCSRQVSPTFTSSGRRTSARWSRAGSRISATACCARSILRFRVVFPNQVIRADDLARAMVDVAVRATGQRGGLVFENRDIQAIVESLHSRVEQSSGRLGIE